MRKIAVRIGLLLLPASLAAQGDRIDAYMKTEMEKASIPGASVVVMRDGKVPHHGSYGVASIELSAPVTPRTVFPLASITKTFTATAVMLLVERNTISLDDALGSILPNVPDNWKPITVRQLLGHTSGLPDVMTNPFTGTWLGDTREDALAKLGALPLQAKPGETWSYNQTNYMLLGMIVEARSGMSFDEFLKRHVLDPLSPGAFVYGDSKVVVPNRGSWYSIIDFS